MRRYERLFPPGYEYRAELWLTGILWGGAAGVSALRFAMELYAAVGKLYQRVRCMDLSYISYRMVLREGARVEAFAELAGWYWALYLPVLLFLAVMPLYHYFYYFRDARSIYVMRRLPGKGITFKSCVRGPALEACIILSSAALLYFLYYGIYCWGVPAECMPRYY